MGDYRRGLDWWIDHLQVVTTDNYTTVADFRTSQIITR
jgi:hypothetical protein